MLSFLNQLLFIKSHAKCPSATRVSTTQVGLSNCFFPKRCIMVPLGPELYYSHQHSTGEQVQSRSNLPFQIRPDHFRENLCFQFRGRSWWWVAAHHQQIGMLHSHIYGNRLVKISDWLTNLKDKQTIHKISTVYFSLKKIQKVWQHGFVWELELNSRCPTQLVPFKPALLCTAMKGHYAVPWATISNDPLVPSFAK